MRTLLQKLPLELILVVSFCGFLFFYGLGSFGLVGPDEPRYAQVAREMLQRDDYITPTLHGDPWLEKPALYYWRARFAFDLFGERDWAARLPSATFALGMVVVIFFHMRRFRPGGQLDAALLTASCAAVIAFSRGASIDMQLAAPFTVAMLGWYAWYETRKKFWLLDLYIFLGIATLAKGPVAIFLAGMIVLVFCWLRRELKTAIATLWVPGVLIFCAIVLPWFIAVQWKNPEFLYVFILQHNLQRFATELYQHTQPNWYYIPVFLLALVPWTFFAIPALVDAVRSCWHDWRAERDKDPTTRKNPDAFPEFLVLWTLLPVAFFSMSESKLPGYILPAIAPCAILTADYLLRMRENKLTPLINVAHAALTATFVSLFLIFPWYFLQNQQLTRNAKMLTAVIAVAIFIIVYATLRRTGTKLLRAVTLVPVVLTVAYILKVAAPVVDQHYSTRPLAKTLSALGMEYKTKATLDVNRQVKYGLGFYENRRVYDYNANEVPKGEHVLIVKVASREKLDAWLPNRRRLKIGSYAAQKLEFYWVGPVSDPAAAALPPPKTREDIR